MVAGLKLASDVDERTLAATLGVDGFVDFFLARGRAGQLDAQAAVTGDGDDGAHFAHGVERDGAFVDAAGDLHLGRSDEVDVVLAHGLGQICGN